MGSRTWRHWWMVAICSVLIAGIGLADSADAKKKRRRSSDGWLGVYIQDVDEDIMDAWDLPDDDGVLIDDVVDDSPAEDAGLETGDVIIKFNDQNVSSTNRLRRLIRRADPGTEVEIVVIRDGDEETIDVEIGDRDDDYDFNWLDGSIFGLWDDHHSPIIVPRAPRAPRALRAPRAPRAVEFFDYRESRGYLGVHIRDLNDQMGEYFGVVDGDGALIEEIEEDSPAEEAGIRAGDVIVEIAGSEVDDVDEVLDELEDYDEGDEVEVVVMRDRSRQSFTVTVDEDDDYDRDRYRYRSRRHNPLRDAFIWHTDDDDLEDIDEEIEEAMEELREELREMEEELRELKRGG